MGAFGELLIQYWGGDLDSYRGNMTKKEEINITEPTEEEKEQFRFDTKVKRARKVKFINFKFNI